MRFSQSQSTPGANLRDRLLGLLCGLVAYATASAESAYRNPIIPGNLADPAVIRHEGVYYLYATGEADGDNGTRVFTSTNLVDWVRGPVVFQPGPPHVWAPDVWLDPVSGRFYLYYTVNQTVGVAEAAGPLGPFRVLRKFFDRAIDAHLFRDDDGKLFLYYVQLPGFRISVVPMATPTEPAGEPSVILQPETEWEKRAGRVTEGPWIIKHRDRYYLLYSGSGADTPDYAVGYATADHPLGPFARAPNNPIVQRSEGLFGPGHGCAIQDTSGRWWHVYHQKRHDRVEWDRFLCIDPLWFDAEGRLHGRASRGTSEPGPVTGSAPEEVIDAATLDHWSAPYRGWHYWPEHVVPARPVIGGITNLVGTDVPTVYRLPGNDKYFMSFIGFDGQGYQSFVAESDDLLHWGDYRLAMGYGPAGEFDHGGCVIGAFLYESYDLKANRVLKPRDGKFWTLYGAYPRQGGYELRPGYEGVAVSEDGLTWRRAKPEPILSVFDADCASWEADCIYQPWLVEHRGRFFNFYNAANGGREQTGLAFSADLLNWLRYPANPVVHTRPDGFDANFCSDPKVFRDEDHWTMFYFGVGRGGAHIMIAFSRDLVHWTAHPEPLYRAGGNPSGLDKQYAHKISLIYNDENDTFYMFYNAVPGKGGITGGRGIGLITSRPLP